MENLTLFYDAIAYIGGSSAAPRLRGTVKFKSQDGGTWVYVDISGLPSVGQAQDGKLQVSPFGFDIHEGAECGDNTGDNPFTAAGKHWKSPDGQLHGIYAGDFPILVQCNGFVKFAHFTDRFTPEDLIGKTVVIHQSSEDCKTQPRRIGCGVIV